MKRYNIVMVYDVLMEKILFCKRKKPPYIGKLNLPGGKWEEGETFPEAAYRELQEETGMQRCDVTPLFHLMDFAYYPTDSIIELYVCRLLSEKEPIPEKGGNELRWIRIQDADFGDPEQFAGDGNILHCFRLAQRYRREIFGTDRNRAETE